MASENQPQARSIDQFQDWIEEDEKRHELARALRTGVEAMRSAAKRYQFMRPNPGELAGVRLGNEAAPRTTTIIVDGEPSVVQAETQFSFTYYDLRVDRSALLNDWADSIRDIARMPFRSRIDLEDWDEELQGEKLVKVDEEGVEVPAGRKPGWVDDIDGEGSTLDQWAQQTFESALFDGVSYGLVDQPSDSFPDAASRRRAGAHPYVTRFARADLRRIVIEFVLGRPRVKEVTLYQPISVTDDSDPNAWIEGEIEAYKVITAGDPRAPRGAPERRVRVRVYVKQGEGFVEDPERRATIEPDDPREELLDVPLVPFYGERIAAYRGWSPFLNTAWTQNAVWNHGSEMQGKARDASVTLLHESGALLANDPEGRPIAGSSNIRFRQATDPQAKMEFVETSGDALRAIKEIVQYLRESIQQSHRQLRTSAPSGPVTAREITLEGVYASSAMAMWVIMHEAGWKRMLDLVALLGGLPKRGKVSIPHEFGLPSSGMERNADLYKQGFMSARNYWGEAMRAGDVDEQSFRIEDEIFFERRRDSEEETDAIIKLRLAGDLSRETVWEEMQSRGALSDEFDPEEEERRLEEEKNSEGEDPAITDALSDDDSDMPDGMPPDGDPPKGKMPPQLRKSAAAAAAAS